MKSSDIIIIGAGVAGLMAARELGKVGKNIIILEARNRIGGRIKPLNETDFGYPAQGGAEWVHGEAPISKALIQEAGLTLIPGDGELWSNRTGELTIHQTFIGHNDLLKEKLNALTEDISIADFLEQNFPDEKDADLKNSIIKMVEGYDAADPKLSSTLTLRQEWLSKSDWDDHRIKEGYGALVKFLEHECKKYNVKIYTGCPVEAVSIESDAVSIRTHNKTVYKAAQVIVTIPIILLKDIEFNPDIKEKIEIASTIGFGSAVKAVIKFKTRWWNTILEKDMSKMGFLLCNEKFQTWWTQYPDTNPVLVGWMAGPEASKYKDHSSEELLEVALTSLSHIFNISNDEIKKKL